MTCSCRSSALRAFVRSIAQIHFPEAQANSTPWLSRRCLATLPRGATLPRAAAAVSWSRTFHTSMRNYNQSQEAYLMDEEESSEGRQEEVSSSHAESSSFTELSLEAIDSLAAEIHAADAVRRSRPSSSRVPAGWTPQTGRKERAPYSEAHARNSREHTQRPAQSRGRILDADTEQPIRKREDWKIQKAALKEKFPEGWQPRKKLSPDALAGIRALHEQFPEDYTTEVLANKFEVSPEAIRRILRSKWEPSPEEEERRQERWFNRGKQVWSRWAELGKKPPTRWRDEGIERKPYRRQSQYDEEEDDDVLGETGNSRLIARSKLAKNLM